MDLPGIPSLEWRREAAGVTHYAHYELVEGGNPTGWAVLWCGHPTALRPYYIVSPTHSLVTGRAYRSAAEAKSIAFQLYLSTPVRLKEANDADPPVPGVPEPRPAAEEVRPRRTVRAGR